MAVLVLVVRTSADQAPDMCMARVGRVVPLPARLAGWDPRVGTSSANVALLTGDHDCPPNEVFRLGPSLGVPYIEEHLT